jgi:lipopolysaccharide transport system permease protein
MQKIIASALADIRAGIARRDVGIALATEDIGDQHKRTTLGPLWLLVNYLAFAATFIFIFHGGAVDRAFAAYIGVGLLVWFFIMDTINQGIGLFAREESFIRGTNLPLSVYVMRLTLQNVIRAGYALLGCLAILVLVGTPPSLDWLWSLAGMAVVVLAAPAVATVFAFLGAFFPDSQFIVSNLMRVAMFATPVFWQENGTGGILGVFYHWNPFTWFLDMVRVPVVEGGFPMKAFVVCLVGTALFWALAVVLLGALRRRVALVL